jgi:bleomycin hydrolase
MQRMGKKPVDLAEIYTARNSYHDKAKLYVLNNGAISWGDGGELHDVINMYKKYGAVPQDVYSGLKPGQTTNNFKEMQGN